MVCAYTVYVRSAIWLVQMVDHEIQILHKNSVWVEPDPPTSGGAGVPDPTTGGGAGMPDYILITNGSHFVKC